MARVVCKHPSCNCSFHCKASMLQHFRDTHCSQLHVAASKKTFPSQAHCKSFFGRAAGLEQPHIVVVNLTTQHIAVAHLTEQLSRTNLIKGCKGSTFSYADLAPPITLQMKVACNDCRRTFKSTDSLHQHQWDSALHTRVSRMPNNASEVRQCSRCMENFLTANALEQHFVDLHPLSIVPAQNDENYTWQNIACRFTSAWKKPTVALHRIDKIFKVYNPGWRWNGFEEYRKELKKEFANQQLVQLGPEEDIDVRNRVLDNGNELLRFHGTIVKCKLGVSTAQGVNGAFSSLCSDPGCSLCRILKTGFKISKCRVENFQRFGRGIYCSATSSKANDYVRCLEQSAPNSSSPSCKVMMVCKVLAGRLHRSTHNLQHLTCPLPGFHSVQGDPGEDLNYDELVVYDDRAILPAYIVLYSSD